MNTNNIKFELNKLKGKELLLLGESLTRCIKLLPAQLVGELHLKSIEMTVGLIYHAKKEELRKHLNSE